jgi:hypothetical protein
LLRVSAEFGSAQDSILFSGSGLVRMRFMTTRELIVPDGDVPLAVRVHSPDDSHVDGEVGLPTVVVTGSWLTVKEQMPDVYAARLAARGFVAVTFDFAGFGASGGGLRQTEIPVRKMRNLAAVVDWLRCESGVDGERIGVMAVCASAQYTLGALARGLPVSAFVSVAGWFHDRASVAGFYGGQDGIIKRLSRAEAATRALLNGEELPLVPAYGPGDDRSGMALEMDYYANPDRGAVPTWRNEMSELSWGHWLTYDAFASLPGVRVPSLFVHSDNAVLPDNVRQVADKLGDLATIAWTEGEQTDFYDRPDQVEYAVEAAARHLRHPQGAPA